jgi:lipoprotein NlpI
MEREAGKWAACTTKDYAAAPDAVITACTEVIASFWLQTQPEYLATAFGSRANAYTVNGDPDHALADSNEAIRLAPARATHYYDRAMVYQVKGDNDRALADYDLAIQIDPSNAPALWRRAGMHELAADYEAAIADLTEVVRLDPDYALAYRKRGFDNMHAGRYRAAIPDLARAVAGDPTEAYPALWLYLARARSGDDTAAAELAANATRLEPSAWPYAVIELYLGQRTPEAMLAAPTTPDDRCEAQFYLGEWKLLRADRAAAIEALEAAANTCPKDFVELADAKAELKRLGQ